MARADDPETTDPRGDAATRTTQATPVLAAQKAEGPGLSELVAADELGGYQVVGTFPNVIMANLARAKLASVGIRARVPDEETVSVDPFFANLIGGVKVVTLAIDAADARAILADVAADEDDPDDEAHEPRCPACEWPYLRNVRGKVRCERCGYKGTIDAATRRTPYRAGGRRRGDPVFRFVRRHTGLGFFIGLVGGALIAGLLPHHVSTESRAFVMALCFVVCSVAGWLTRTEICSRPTCRARLPASSTVCPQCKGHVEGEITRAQDHFVRRATWLKGETFLPSK